MALLLTRLGRTELARSYFRDIQNQNDYYFFTLGKTTEWDDEDNPDQPVDTAAEANKFRRNILFVQQISTANTCNLVRRIQWESGTIYDRYDDAYHGLSEGDNGYENRSWRTAQTLPEANFYVITGDNNIYKCIDNRDVNGDVIPSTAEPTSTGTDFEDTADNYRWKYMGTVTDGDKTRFLDSNWIPVRKLTGGNGESFDVNGEIDSITISSGGSGYTAAPEIVINGDGEGAGATCTIDGSGQVDSITITSSGSGYSFALVEFLPSNGEDPASITDAVARVTLGDVDLTDSLDQYAVEQVTGNEGAIDRIEMTANGINYVDGDVTIIIDGDGSGATGTPVIDANGQIVSITINNSGTNYTYAEVNIIQSAGTGTGAAARAVIAPINGHGDNMVRELYSTTIAISTSLADPDNSDLVLNNDFRQIGLIKNLRKYSDTTQAFVSLTGNACFEIELDTAAELAKYSVDDEVTSSDGGSFVVAQTRNSEGYFLYLQPIKGTVTVDSVLTNTTTSATTLASSINNVNPPEFSIKTGELIYMENRGNVSRQQDQAETIKAFITF